MIDDIEEDVSIKIWREINNRLHEIEIEKNINFRILKKIKTKIKIDGEEKIWPIYNSISDAIDNEIYIN